MEKVILGKANPKDLLDGSSVTEDLQQLSGYLYSLGIIQNTKTIFPSSHILELTQEFLTKHNLIK